MKQKEVIELTTEEIKEQIDNKQESLSKMKITHSISPIENPMLIRKNRRDIARLKTELNKRNKEIHNK